MAIIRIEQMSLDLKPIDGVDKLQVVYYGGRGWFIHYWMGKDALGSPLQYTMFNGFVIFGGFGLLNVMKKLKKEDYMYGQVDGSEVAKVISDIEEMKLGYFQECAKSSVHDYPIFIIREEDLRGLKKEKPISEKIDDKIEQWHKDQNTTKQLHEYLGMTEQQYAEFVTDGKIPDNYKI